MHHRTRSLQAKNALATRAPAAWVASLALVGVATAQCQYSVVQWSNWICPSGWQEPYVGTGLNDLGAWCGHRNMCDPGVGDLPIYCPPNGTPQVLAMPPGADTDGAQAMALNNNGVVVGWYRVPPGNLDRACAWLPDGTVLDDLVSVAPSDRSNATDVNDAGVIVGVHYIAGGTPAFVPFVWTNGEVEFLDPSPFTRGKAVAITEDGVVCGILGSETINARVFRWTKGAMSILEPLPGFTVCRARGMNDLGWIVGDSAIQVEGGGLFQVPTLWIDDTPIQLQAPPGYTSSGAAGCIDDDGVIAGSFSSSGSGFPAIRVIWIGNEVYAINDLTLPGSPSIGTIVGINDAGQLLASGGPRLVTPITSLLADVTGDCAVDGDDLGVLLASWGAPDFDPRCDFNGDGIVNGDDLGTLLGEWTAVR